MSQDTKTAVGQRTQQLLDGPLKHIRGAALAAALLPLASVAAAPASAATCQSGGTVCGVVFNDANHDGVLEAGETGISGANVSFNGEVVMTNPDGTFEFTPLSPGENLPPGSYTVSVTIPPNTQPSPVTMSDGAGNSVATVAWTGSELN